MGISKVLAFFAIIFTVIGCSTTANLYPVQGPLAQIKPISVIKAHVNGIMGNTGKISLVLPDGEKCEGRWSSAAGTSVNVGTVNLFSQYGSVFGTGFSVANNPGVNRGEAIIVGEKGTVIEVEFYTGSGTANGFGLAKDNHGNVYKVLF
jgi:hypothetical protein